MKTAIRRQIHEKSFISVFLISLFIFAALVPAEAFDACEKAEAHISVLENGVTVESALVAHEEKTLFGNLQTKHASKSEVYKYNGAIIAAVTLDVNF